MENTKTIEVLNSLIEINNDRIEGYQTAAEETEHADLKVLFVQFEAVSRECNATLAKEILKLGGEVLDGTTTTGKFFRVWMDLKSVVTGHDRRAILNSCEFGEKAAQETYSDALENNNEVLSNEIKALIFGQKTILGSNLYKIESLLEEVV